MCVCVSRKCYSTDCWECHRGDSMLSWLMIKIGMAFQMNGIFLLSASTDWSHEQKTHLVNQGYILATSYGIQQSDEQGVPVAFPMPSYMVVWCTASTNQQDEKDWKRTLEQVTIHHLLYKILQGGVGIRFKKNIMEWRGHVKEICELWGLYKSRFLHQVDESNKHYH